MMHRAALLVVALANVTRTLSRRAHSARRIRLFEEGMRARKSLALGEYS